MNKKRAMRGKVLCLLMGGLLALSGKSVAQENDLGRKVDEAFAGVRERHFEKAAALTQYGKQIFPYLEKYINDPSEEVRDFVVALTRKQTSPEALALLSRMLEDKEMYIADKAAVIVHDEYDCAQVAAAPRAKTGIKFYLTRRPRSARAVLLLSCFRGDAEAVELLKSRRKEQGTHEDGGIHHDVPFRVAVEMALAASGDAAAVAKVKDYVSKGDTQNLFFIFDNAKFVKSTELHLAFLELLKDKRPAYHPFPHEEFAVRVCDLALTALTSTNPLPITADYQKLKVYTNEELEAAYTQLKEKFEKEAK